MLFLTTNKLVKKLVKSGLYGKTKAYELAQIYRDAKELPIDSPLNISDFADYHKLDNNAILSICSSKPTST